MRKNIEELVKGGKKGVTNCQMIPAIKENAADAENLKVLFEAYPEIFKSAAKYTPDNVKVAAEAIVKETDPTFSILTGKKIRGEKVTRAKKEELVFAASFKSENNEKLAALVKATANWKEVVGDAAEMVKMAIQDKSPAEIGLAIGASKDKVYTVLFRKNGKSVVEKLTNAGLTAAI